MQNATTIEPKKNEASAPTPDYDAIKAKQNAVWSAGDYAIVGSTLQIVGEQLCAALDARPGAKFLDVAAGNGNVTLAAARRWCDVTSTDYVPALLDSGRRRAEANGMSIEYKVADAEDLPFEDGSYDYVASSFGVMFTPNQAKAASEMARVCRKGGRIGLANWTPGSFIGEVFKLVGRFVPPPAGLNSPALWGTEERLQEFFGDIATNIRIEKKMYDFRYKSVDHFVDIFSTYYGPTLKVLEALDEEKRAQFTAELRDLLDSWNEATDGTLTIPSEYLEVVVEL